MKYTKQQTNLAFVVILSAVSTAVSADAFDGLYLGVGLAVNKMSAELSTYYANTTGSVDNFFRQSHGDEKFDVAGSLAVGYGLNIGQFNFAFELSFQNSHGESQYYSDISSQGSSQTQSAELSKGMAVSIMPRFRVAKDTLVYGRLGYVRANADLDYEVSHPGSGFTQSHSTKVGGCFMA